MKVLIIGLGYAGNRYLRAFQALQGRPDCPETQLGYVSPAPKSSSEPHFPTVAEALDDFSPEIVVVTVNDIYHAQVLDELAAFRGTIICEKPLLTPTDDLSHTLDLFGGRDNFFVAQVERYSPLAETLRKQIADNQWQLSRASLFWAKNRIADPRPTCGVTSEIIHPLDMLQWLTNASVEVSASTTTVSDFSISGPGVTDTAIIAGTVAGAPLTGYASFVGLERMRAVELIFTGDGSSPIYTRLVFDSPIWDADSLTIWTVDTEGQTNYLHEERLAGDTKSPVAGLDKQIRLCAEVLQWHQGQSALRLPCISEGAETQRLLNTIDHLHREPAARGQLFQSTDRMTISRDANPEFLG